MLLRESITQYSLCEAKREIRVIGTRRYTYLSKPKYKWQEQFFTKDNNKQIMFGDIISLNSETEPPKYKPDSNNPKPYYLKHHIYWTDKRQPEYICMETDAILIQQFIDELNDMDIPDEWILYMH